MLNSKFSLVNFDLVLEVLIKARDLCKKTKKTAFPSRKFPAKQKY